MYNEFETQVDIRVFYQRKNDSALGRSLKQIVDTEHWIILGTSTQLSSFLGSIFPSH